MSQKLAVDNYEWIKDTSQSNKNFIKNYNDESDEGYFLEDTFKNYMNFIMIYHFY